MAGKGRGCLRGCLWAFVILLALGVIGGLAGTSQGGGSDTTDQVGQTTEAVAGAGDDLHEGTVAFTVDTGGAPTDDWPLFVSVGGMDDQQVSPAGGSVTVTAGSHALAAASRYFIASDGTLLETTDVTPSTETVDDGQTADASLILEKVDPSTTQRSEYQDHIDTAYGYLVTHVATDRADELKAAAEKLLPPENAPPTDNGTLTATFIDVGQGDATLLQLPDGKSALVDAGPSSGASAVISTLRAKGVSRIDYLVATHPDADHIGGMATVIASFDIGEVWAPNATNNTRTFERFLDAVDAKGLTITAGYRGRDIVSDDGSASYSVTALGPASEAETTNESSLVLRVGYGSTSFLLTGDADASDIASDASGHVDVLKVSHHGSRTGTTLALARELTPKVAIISYEVGNSYGHPTQDCLDDLSAVGAAVYGTGANGDVTVTSDGSSVSVSCEREGTVVAGSRESAATSASSTAATGSGTAAPASADSASSSDTASSSESSDSGSSTAPAAAIPSASSSSAVPSATGQTDVVYITTSGRGHKYHRQGCRTLSRSKNVASLSRSQAEAQGYTACKVCNP